MKKKEFKKVIFDLFITNTLYSHYLISFTWVSMKLISSSDKPYFWYNCLSISGIDWVQSISELDVKFWRGINLNTDDVTFIVPLPLYNRTLKKFVCIYFSQFSVSYKLANCPIVKKVSVQISFGLPIIRAGGSLALVE